MGRRHMITNTENNSYGPKEPSFVLILQALTIRSQHAARHVGRRVLTDMERLKTSRKITPAQGPNKESVNNSRMTTVRIRQQINCQNKNSKTNQKLMFLYGLEPHAPLTVLTFWHFAILTVLTFRHFDCLTTVDNR